MFPRCDTQTRACQNLRSRKPLFEDENLLGQECFWKRKSHFPNLQKGVVGAANVAQPTREYAEHAQSPGFHTNWPWWHTAIISEVGKLRQEGQNFKASLGYMRPYVEK